MGQQYGVATLASSRPEAGVAKANLLRSSARTGICQQFNAQQAGMIVPNEILRAGRAAVGITQSELSEISGVGKRTILRIERNERVAVRTLQKVQAALETKGVEFTPSADGKGPGLRLPLSLLSRDDLRF
jgi:DNA-binding XRE family transcriptional regulator